MTISAATQTIRGPLIGYSVDCYQDMLGFRECNRITYPEIVKNMGRKGKLSVAAGAIAASIGLMGLLYSLTPSEWNNPNRLKDRKHIEQIEKTQNLQSLEDIVG